MKASTVVLRACVLAATCAALAESAQATDPPPLLPLPAEDITQLQSDVPPPLPAGENTTPVPVADHVDNDFTVAGLHRAADALRARHGGDVRQIPLAEKAAFLEWVLWRYHRNPYGQIATAAVLPRQPGVSPQWPADSDTSTWNGTLLSALSWKYAVTRDPETLNRITTLLGGLDFYSQVTGKPGCYARSVSLAGGVPVDGSLQKFGVARVAGAGGEQLDWVGDPAKGTYNQLAGGYASLMMYVYNDLPPETQQLARRLTTDLVMHVLDNDYKIRNPQGKPTTYGDLTPIIATVGVPFNAHVAYLIVALGEQYPPADEGQKGSIEHQFYRLRAKHHAYYENPLKNPIRPQRVGSNVLVKGMNDRFHLMSAAYHSLALEVARAPREGRELDRTFLYRMGQSLVWTMRKIGGDRNALCNFMYAGMVSDPTRFNMMIEKAERGEAVWQLNRGIADGIEQLRRFPLDRFRGPGASQPAGGPQWVDQQRPDDFQWKADPTLRFIPAGPPGDHNVAAIDYLAAYWLMRLHALDRQEVAVRNHAAVLGR